MWFGATKSQVSHVSEHVWLLPSVSGGGVDGDTAGGVDGDTASGVDVSILSSLLSSNHRLESRHLRILQHNDH